MSGDWVTRALASIALDPRKGHDYRRAARARCGEILEARRKESK